MLEEDYALIEKQILWLEITMDNLMSVTVFHGAYDLLEEPTCLILGCPSLLNNVVEQFARCLLVGIRAVAAAFWWWTSCILENHNDFVRRRDNRVSSLTSVLSTLLRLSRALTA